jgi:transposase
VLIARLASELRCYEPERAGAVWTRLRHLGARRNQLTTSATAAVNQIRDLLDCAWPAALAASPGPFRSVTWCASLAVVPGPVRGRPGAGPPRRPGPVHRSGAAGAAPVGRDPAVPADHPGRVRRAGRPRRGHRAPPRRAGTRTLALGDWRDARARLAETETRMRAVMDELGLADLVTTITGLTIIGAAAILAETGDPARFATPRALVKHAGLCPRENASGTAQGKTSISGRGRPGLRLAAWRAVWAAMPNNPVMAARFAYLTTRQDNRLAPQQARTACAAALLRWLHVVITRQVAWDPAIAASSTPAQQAA